MRISRAIVVLVCSVAIAGFVYAGNELGQDSLTKLIDGNKRFMSGEVVKKDIGESRRQELAKGQQPGSFLFLPKKDFRISPRDP